MGHPGIRPGDNVSLLRNISRNEDLSYGVAGQSGEVIEVFTQHDRGFEYPSKVMHAKVKMDLPGKPIKTFRLTSLMRK